MIEKNVLRSNILKQVR